MSKQQSKKTNGSEIVPFKLDSESAAQSLTSSIKRKEKQILELNIKQEISKDFAIRKHSSKRKIANLIENQNVESKRSSYANSRLNHQSGMNSSNYDR